MELSLDRYVRGTDVVGFTASHYRAGGHKLIRGNKGDKQDERIHRHKRDWAENPRA